MEKISNVRAILARETRAYRTELAQWKETRLGELPQENPNGRSSNAQQNQQHALVFELRRRALKEVSRLQRENKLDEAELCHRLATIQGQLSVAALSDPSWSEEAKASLMAEQRSVVHKSLAERRKQRQAAALASGFLDTA